MSWNRVNSLWGMTTAMCSIRLSYVVVLNVTYKNNALEKQKFVLDALRITEYRIINLTSYCHNYKNKDCNTNFDINHASG